ncbi:hypothetical protein J1N35_044433, partial [Gossypium stocksii]
MAFEDDVGAYCPVEETSISLISKEVSLSRVVNIKAILNEYEGCSGQMPECQCKDEGLYGVRIGCGLFGQSRK